HAHVLAGFVDVDEFGFHVQYRLRSTFALRASVDTPSRAGACTPKLPPSRCALRRAGARMRWERRSAKGGRRTLMAVNHRILSPARLPVPPLSHKIKLRVTRLSCYYP